MIQPGETVPSVPVKLIDANGVSDTTSDAVLNSGRVVLFSVPGAFTPTCDTSHLPGFIANQGKMRSAGVSRIVCVANNDHHVMRAWAESQGALGKVDFIADGNGELMRALGLDRDMSKGGMGTRYVRSAMLVNDGVVEDMFVETAPGVNVTGAPAILLALEASRANV